MAPSAHVKVPSTSSRGELLLFFAAPPVSALPLSVRLSARSIAAAFGLVVIVGVAFSTVTFTT